MTELQQKIHNKFHKWKKNWYLVMNIRDITKPDPPELRMIDAVIDDLTELWEASGLNREDLWSPIPSEPQTKELLEEEASYWFDEEINKHPWNTKKPKK